MGITDECGNCNIYATNCAMICKKHLTYSENNEKELEFKKCNNLCEREVNACRTLGKCLELVSFLTEEDAEGGMNWDDEFVKDSDYYGDDEQEAFEEVDNVDDYDEEGTREK